MKICKRALNFIQIIDELGNIRICSWMPDSVVGNILENDFMGAIQSPKAKCIRKKLSQQEYSRCQKDNCPYLANGTIANNLVDMPEDAFYPEELHLAYEGKCNYHCTCCTSYKHMEQGRERDWSDNYARIEEKIKDILPHVRILGSNGRGEVFASPHIMKVLASWQPLAPASKCRVELETNGSLFNEKNWKKIENLGKYNLHVYVTIMSFEEKVYQYLSGTKMPISNIINNLHFIKQLRDQGIINYLELATVVQERNFRELPEFTRRCLEEFGADLVRLRPIVPGGSQPIEVQWFADVRNPYHPYYEEYKEVMKSKIFHDSRVLLWSGDLDSTRGAFPIVNLGKEKYDRLFSVALGYKVLYELSVWPKIKKVIIYGAGSIGEKLHDFLKERCDLDLELITTKGGQDMRSINDILDRKGLAIIIATARRDYREEMLKICKELGFDKVLQAD